MNINHIISSQFVYFWFFFDCTAKGICSFIRVFNKYMLSSYDVSGTVLDTWMTAVLSFTANSYYLLGIETMWFMPLHILKMQGQREMYKGNRRY